MKKVRDAGFALDAPLASVQRPAITPEPIALHGGEEIEDVGGYINAYTSREMTAYYARVLSQDVVMALDVIADIVLNPLFRKADIETERHVILQEIGHFLGTIMLGLPIAVALGMGWWLGAHQKTPAPALAASPGGVVALPALPAAVQPPEQICHRLRPVIKALAGA